MLELHPQHDVKVLPFLRLCVISSSRNAALPPIARLLLVERLTLREITLPFMSAIIFWHRMPCLVELNLQALPNAQEVIAAVAVVHGLTLRRLLLDCHHTTTNELERLVALEMLDMTGCKSITNVHFCSATLRKLYANRSGMTDAGLSRAVHLEVLRVSDCRWVTTVAPFAHTLCELDASYGCGIDNKALSMASKVVALDLSQNEKVTALTSCAASLRELVCPCSGITDESLSSVRGLARLDISHGGGSVTTVTPFARTLRELYVCGSGCRMENYGLWDARGIVKLVAAHNQRITTVAPFALTLRELHASYSTLSDKSLAAATRIVSLDVCNLETVTTVRPFADSLCVLDASYRSGIDDQGLAMAKGIVKLNVRNNSKVATVSPFANTLRSLCATGTEIHSDVGCGVELEVSVFGALDRFLW